MIFVGMAVNVFREPCLAAMHQQTLRSLRAGRHAAPLLVPVLMAVHSEVYASGLTAAIEFGNWSCGAIVMWTR